MKYDYKCRECGARRESNSHDDIRPCSCGGLSKRVFHVNVSASFQPHFNYAVGEHVRNDREFRDALKRKSENNSIKTGMDHDYQPIDPRDIKHGEKALGVTGEGLEETFKRTHDDKVKSGKL